MENQDTDSGRGHGQWMRTVDTDSGCGHGQWTQTRTVDTDRNRRVATNITMIGVSLIASTFLVCYDN